LTELHQRIYQGNNIYGLGITRMVVDVIKTSRTGNGAQSELSDLAKEAFKKPVSLERILTLRLHVGELPSVKGVVSSHEYIKACQELLTVDYQGDGFKSFVNLCLVMLAQQLSIVIVDEPEAFFHPPQASLLGKVFSRFTKDERKLFSVCTAAILSLVFSPMGQVIQLLFVSQEMGM